MTRDSLSLKRRLGCLVAFCIALLGLAASSAGAPPQTVSAHYHASTPVYDDASLNVQSVSAAEPRRCPPIETPAASGDSAAVSRVSFAANGVGDVSQILLRSPKTLQAKFKHAADFGVKGNYNPANAAEFSAAINQHINAVGTRAIQGKNRGEAVTHCLNPSTGLNVISRGGEFVSGWRLSPAQLSNVLQHGGLGGG